MDYIYIGKVTNTHGLKGEIRILSNFSYIDKVMIPEFNLYIGEKYIPVKIITHRIHKNYHMITLEGYPDIDNVIPFKGKKVYIQRKDLNIDGYFDEDYIGLEAFSDRFLGKIVDIIHSNLQELLVIEKEKKQFLVPKVKEFIESVDLEEHKIYIREIEGLFDEN